MKITAEELQQIYRNMSDEELISLDREDLTDVALKVHDQELERRGLNLDAEVEELAAEEPLTSLGSFDSLDEARTAESMLESASIPARLENDTMRGRGFQVMVPASMVEDAQQVLKGPAPVADTDAIIVNARYENGAFVPLEEIDIREGAVVEVHVRAADFVG
jgi:Protein of unknown function DUF104